MSLDAIGEPMYYMTVPMQSFRLNATEESMLNEIMRNNTIGFEARVEFWRLMLHREYNKIKGLPKPKPQDWQIAFRWGGKRK